MKTSGWLCTGMTAGALMMYLFDPQLGRRRRALLRDKIAHHRLRLPEAMEATWNDACNRAAGIRAGLLALLASQGDVPDNVLEDRVRSKLGRVVSHPAWVQVKADHGAVKVAGHVPEREKNRLLATVVSIRGVQKVEEENLVVDPDDQVPDTGFVPGAGGWAPSERLIAGLMGVAMGMYGLRRSGPAGGLMALVGLGLVLRGVTNARLLELRERLGRIQGA